MRLDESYRKRMFPTEGARAEASNSQVCRLYDTETVAGQTSGETWKSGAEGANPKWGESLRQKDRGDMLYIF